MNKKFAILLALSLIAIVCCAGCIDPQDPVDPVDPVVPVDPVDPVTPPVEPVVPAEEYSVFFMLNYDGAGAYTAETVTAGDAVSKPATPTRSGYTFKGWFTAAEGGDAYDFTQAVNADLTLYAQWSKKSSSSSGSSSSGSSTPSTPSTPTTPEAEIGGQSYATIKEAIAAAEEDAVITLNEIPDESLSLEGKKVTLTYPEDTPIDKIKIDADGADNVTVKITESGVEKEVIFVETEVDDDGNLIPSATVNEENGVGDAYTASGLQYLIDNHVNKVMNAPVEDAPTEHVQDGWDVMFYEPAPTSLGTEAESDEESVEKETTDTPESWTITLQNNIIGNVTIAQKPNVEITIEGNNHKFNGNITVDGGSARYETAALTIQNVNFEAETLSADAFINLGISGVNDARYTHGVTVINCIFNETDNGEEIVAIKSYTGGDWNLTIDGCTVYAGMHSLAQLKNVEKNLQVKNCFVYSKNGLNVNNGNNLEMSGCTFDVKGYAVRFGSDIGVYDRVFYIRDSTLKSACAESGDAVIEFRAGAIKYSKLTLEKVTLEGTTKFKGATADTKITIASVPYVPLNAGATQTDFSTAVSNAESGTTINLPAGTYKITSVAAGKTLTIVGSEDTKIDVTSGLSYANGATVRFDGVTIKSEPEGSGYTNGFADFKYAVFNNCVIEGTLGLDFSCEFNGCTFNVAGNYYNVWTWGAGTVTFNGCTFNCDGKALLVYANVLDNGNYHQTVNINGCTFNDIGDDTVTGKAAIEITNTYTPIRTYDVFITETTVNGFAQTVPGAGDFNAAYGSVAGSDIGTNVWGNKCELSSDYLNVKIDGVDVY